MNTNDACTVNKKPRTMLWVTWLFYAFGMILKISQYANLLYLQKHGREFVDGLSFIDILSNMDNFAPGWPIIFYESIRLAAFALLAICIASVGCKRLEKAANAVIIAYTAIFLIYALPCFCFPLRFFVMFSIVLLLIFVVFRFTELKKHKQKIYMVATAVVSSAVVFDRLLYMAMEMLPMVDAAMLVFLLALRCLWDNEEQENERVVGQ